MRFEVAQNYSEDLGWSIKGAAGGDLTDDIALGLIVEYGENKRGYLANAGIQFDDALSFVGTVGMLEEHNEFDGHDDRETVRQMEYGASLKGAYEFGLLSGFELNGYPADAEVDTDDLDAGKLYGLQLNADLDLTNTTFVKFGGGYEWLRWDEGGNDDNLAFSIDASQRLGDVVSLNANAKKGAAEFVYGGGVAFDLSNGGTNSNRLALNLSHIDGYNGIEDDQRVELSWSFGFGSGPVGQTESAGLAGSTGRIRAAADVVETAPGNELLGDVMQRPSFLPERVIARSAGASFCSTVVPHSFVNSAPVGPDAVSMLPGQVAVVLIPDTPPGAFDQAVVKIGENAASYLGSAYSYRFYITENLQGLVIGQPSTVSVILPSETCSIPVQVIPAVTR